MGSFDGAELCKLVDYSLFYNLNSIIYLCNHDLYQDDWLIIVDDCTPRKGNYD